MFFFPEDAIYVHKVRRLRDGGICGIWGGGPGNDTAVDRWLGAITGRAARTKNSYRG